MAKPKFYAVRKGYKPGIYTTWEEASAQVKGFNGAQYKGFETRQEAAAYLRGESQPTASQMTFLEEETPVETAPADENKDVVIYTDGGCITNPGPGGYGVVLSAKGKRKEISGGFRLTTNNRMELTACIAALEALKGDVTAKVYSDSSYLINAVTQGWAKRWQRAGWQRKEGPVPNADLWQRLLPLVEQHQAAFEWVRGHAGNPENERCDQLATEAARKPNLPPDEGYEGGAG